MDSLLFGLRFSSRKNAGQADAATDSSAKPAQQGTETGEAKASPESAKSASGLDDGKTSEKSGHLSLPDTDTIPPVNERNTTMRLSKNNPGRIDDDFDIPNEPVVPGYTPANPLTRTSPTTESRKDPTP